ncbi:SLC13 family permease [Nocardia sp. NBC_00416]|uniref:SLC13 family permease n=1 Tax=Nocardia sp. NBC_00416 TaxID=2975991 RepID=UPI002E23E202
MRPELISIIALGLTFVVAAARSVNLGALGFVTAFLVGTLVLDLTTADIVGGFPGGIFVILVGLTYLFGIAQVNGTLELLVHWCTELVHGRIAAVPWIFFLMAAALMSIGAVFAVAIVAPLAMAYAFRHKINPLLMGMMVVHGALGGAFSPISVYGSFVNGVVSDTGLPSSPTILFLMPLVINAAIALMVYLTMGGRALIGGRAMSETATGAASGSIEGIGGTGTGLRPTSGSGTTAVMEAGEVVIESSVPQLRREQILTLAGLAVLAVGTVAFGLDVGFLALTITAVLSLFYPESTSRALGKVSWSTVFLICGVLTYVEVLERAGTIDYTAGLIAGIGLPLVAALLLCYLGGITSAFASSIAILGVAIPLAVPFLQQGSVSAVGMVTALAVASTVVDVSPFSTNGALVLANCAERDRPRLYRQMLVYSAVIVIAAPVFVWLLLVATGWF